MAYLEAPTWPCDELSARRSINFLPDGPANCSAGEIIKELVAKKGGAARLHHAHRGTLP